MKLLSSEQVKSKTDSSLKQLADEKYRLTTAIQKDTRSLNVVRDEQKTERDRLDREFADYKAKLSTRRSELAQEVAVLEARREAALVPLDSLKLELLEQEAALDARGKNLSSRQLALDSADERMKEREQFIEKKEAELARRERNLHLAEGITNQLLKSAEAGMRELADQEKRINDIQSERQMALTQQEARNQAETHANQVLRDAMVAQQKDLDDERKHIHSQREALKTAWNTLHVKRKA